MAPSIDEEEKVDPAFICRETMNTCADAHVHFAGRVPAGSKIPICVSKDGVNHVSPRVYFLLGK